MPNPLDADPECSQFAKLMLRQAQEENFGFTREQVRSINRTEKGQRIWRSLTEKCFPEISGGKGRRFDFSTFCRELCEPEFSATRRCFKVAKEQFASSDPREVCFVQVWDLCKRVEHVWTDLHSLA